MPSDIGGFAGAHGHDFIFCRLRPGEEHHVAGAGWSLPAPFGQANDHADKIIARFGLQDETAVGGKGQEAAGGRIARRGSGALPGSAGQRAATPR